jgi:sulfur carrier protein
VTQLEPSTGGGAGGPAEGGADGSGGGATGGSAGRPVAGVRATVNGEDRDLPPGATVVDVLTSLDAPARGVAVAVNGMVVPSSTWQAVLVHEGDRIEILTAAQGG